MTDSDRRHPPGTEGVCQGQLHAKPDRRNAASRQVALQEILETFLDQPLLRITVPQVSRLLHRSRDACERMLETLVAEGLLSHDTSSQYNLSQPTRQASRWSRQATTTLSSRREATGSLTKRTATRPRRVP